MPNWRNAFKSDFLASWDIDSNVTLTIQRVEVKDVQLQKKETKVVAHFAEQTFPNGEKIKPMVLNATNCKKLNVFTGTKETDKWINISVEIGVIDNTGRIGEAKGLSIMKVIGQPFDRLSEIIKLFTSSKGLTEEEQSACNRVISNEEANAYDKTLNFLKGKQ